MVKQTLGFTDITFSKSVMFGGEYVEAGTYGLYSLLSKDGWVVQQLVCKLSSGLEVSSSFPAVDGA